MGITFDGIGYFFEKKMRIRKAPVALPVSANPEFQRLHQFDRRVEKGCESKKKTAEKTHSVGVPYSNFSERGYITPCLFSFTHHNT